jgi:hypothetical protein
MPSIPQKKTYGQLQCQYPVISGNSAKPLRYCNLVDSNETRFGTGAAYANCWATRKWRQLRILVT